MASPSVRCQVDLVYVLEDLLELGDLFLLVGRHDVQRLEPVVNVDAVLGATPLVLQLLRGVFGTARDVSNVPDRGLDDVVGAEIPTDGLRLRRRLHYDKFLGHITRLLIETPR